MMRTSLKLVLALALAAGCDKGIKNDTPRNGPGIGTPVPEAAATVTLTSVRFADDCGGTPPSQAPIAPASPAVPAASKSRVAPAAEEESPQARRCEQTSIQLSVAAKRATDVRVKSVEVFDEHGKSLGVLATSIPTRWSAADGAYTPWDQTVAAGQTAQVSYVLQQPSFVNRYDDRDRTYTVKVLASVGGVDQPLQTAVMVVAQPPAIPT